MKNRIDWIFPVLTRFCQMGRTRIKRWVDYMDCRPCEGTGLKIKVLPPPAPCPECEGVGLKPKGDTEIFALGVPPADKGQQSGIEFTPWFPTLVELEEHCRTYEDPIAMEILDWYLGSWDRMN